MVMRKIMRWVAREPGVLYGDEKDYETVWPENRMYFVVMRKDMRLGGHRTGCTLW